MAVLAHAHRLADPVRAPGGRRHRSNSMNGDGIDPDLVVGLICAVMIIGIIVLIVTHL